MTSVFNAADARKLVQTAHSIDGSYKRTETDRILKGIQNAAAMGKTDLSVTLKSDTDDIIQLRLKGLGFTVKYVTAYDQRDAPYLQITW